MPKEEAVCLLGECRTSLLPREVPSPDSHTWVAHTLLERRQQHRPLGWPLALVKHLKPPELRIRNET